MEDKVRRDDHVVVITGAGGMGMAVAPRIAAGATIVIADVDERALSARVSALSTSGYRVVGHAVDVSDRASVEELAKTARALGRVSALVHTAGVSPVAASVDAILRVDLRGTALILDEFADVMEPGGAGVCIASMAGSMGSLEADFEQHLASTPTDELLELPGLGPDVLVDPGMAYFVSKRANQLRVRHASVNWGANGAGSTRSRRA